MKPTILIILWLTLSVGIFSLIQGCGPDPEPAIIIKVYKEHPDSWGCTSSDYKTTIEFIRTGIRKEVCGYYGKEGETVIYVPIQYQ